jgi:Mrp family chromosome partitioning ATPase
MIADAAIATIMDNARRKIIIVISFQHTYASETKRLHQTCAYSGKSVVNLL